VFGTPGSALNTTSIPEELTGDLNGDGVADLLIYGVVTQNPPLFAVQTFISNGKGGYTPSAVQTFPFLAYADGYLKVANTPFLTDLNGDGKLDLLCGIQIAYGNGDGTFASAVTVPFLSSSFVSTYAADLNGDGKTDILAVNASPAYPNLEYSVTPFLNQGAGSFTPTATVPIGQGGMELYGYQPAFLDLNGDGNLDIILQWNIVALGAPSVSVLLSNGDGTFASPTELNVSSPPNIGNVQCSSYEIGSGDLNSDGRQDLILATCDDDMGDSDAIIFLGKGDGTFGGQIVFALPTPPNVIISITPNFVVQDVNLDGKLDLVFGSGRLALGNGDGTFTSAAPLFPLTAPYSYPLLQVQLTGNPVPSLVFLPLAVTPPPAAVFTPQTSSSAALSLTTLAVGTHSITAKYSGDTNYSADSSNSVTVTVSQAASVTAATSSANPSFAGQSVTFAANVTSNGPTPTGNVTFNSGSTVLGTVALSGGSAAYTTTSLTTVGTQTITASYSGDADTQASSATVSQVVNAAFALAPGSGGSTTLTVQSGQTVNAPINVTGTAAFSGSVTFSCSGLPANASCSFSPATITVSGTPAVSTLLSVNTVGGTTVSRMRQDEHRGISAVAYGLSLAGLVLFWPMRRREGRLGTMLICMFALTVLGLNGCSGGGSGSNPAKTTPGTYNFTVTATSGNVQAQTAYTLVVQ
jgi:Bacterial Ig-like domain (group 3)/FG-GAP-like repeat